MLEEIADGPMPLRLPHDVAHLRRSLAQGDSKQNDVLIPPWLDNNELAAQSPITVDRHGRIAPISVI